MQVFDPVRFFHIGLLPLAISCLCTPVQPSQVGSNSQSLVSAWGEWRKLEGTVTACSITTILPELHNSSHENIKAVSPFYHKKYIW